MSNNHTKNQSVILAILVAVVISLIPLPVLDADEEQKNPIQQSSRVQNEIATPTLKAPAYAPPQKKDRAGTFARTLHLDAESALTTLSVLAPNHIGLTMKKQPSLYWYLEKPINNPINFTLTHNLAIQPLLQTHLKIGAKNSIRAIRLADYGIRLLPGKQYQWYIEIVQDTKNEVRRNIAGGMIKRIEPDQALLAQIEKSETSTVPTMYAQEGIWYDAIETLATLIDTSPSSKKEREQFSSLLTEVGLLEVAEYVTKSETTLMAQKKVLTKGGNNAKKRKFAVPVNMPTYNPPKRGAASNLVGGGTRGTGTDMGTISAIVPINVGLTTKEQPSLFWHLSETTTNRIDFILNDPEAIPPLLEITLGTNIKPGVQRLNLADYGAHLSSGKQYYWFVAQVTDPAHRSKDIISEGLIERREPPETLLAKLSKAGKTTMHHVYASEGIWYDAFSAISDLIAQAPDDRELRKQRSSLLEQVGLSKIDEQETKTIEAGH